MRPPGSKPTLAVWKFASCDGCQLSLLDLEDDLLALTDAVEIAEFHEATSRNVEGPVRPLAGRGLGHHRARRPADQADPSLIARLITIGACATAGGVQALRNFADVDEFTRIVYASPQYISTLATSTPISAHVKVDFELRGCPIEQAPAARGRHRVPARAPTRTSPPQAFARECKRRGTVCVTVAHGTPCLGPVTHAGCGALCPAYNRGCFGCFGPMETPNTRALIPLLHRDGLDPVAVHRVFQTFNAAAPEFRAVAEGD